MRIMKRLMLSMTILLLLTFAAMVVSSCDTDSDNYNYCEYSVPTAIVTVRPASAITQFYLQLDDSTSLLPTNIEKSPYGDKEVRAYVNYKYTDSNALIHNKAVYINWMDSILTKRMVADKGSDNAKAYGDDPVDIVKSFETCAEDGYMNIRFRTTWGNRASHTVNLSWTKDADGNITAEFHHNANGDTSARTADGMVAFRLDDEFNKPDKPYYITLKWKSSTGYKTAKFKYIPRKY